MAKSYKDLEVYQLSFELFSETHHFSLLLPKYEIFELGGQLRRSADSVNSNMVEGYGRKKYKKDFIKFLIYAHSSNDETINHLKKLGVLYPELSMTTNKLIADYNKVGIMLHKFIEYVANHWRT